MMKAAAVFVLCWIVILAVALAGCGAKKTSGSAALDTPSAGGGDARSDLAASPAADMAAEAAPAAAKSAAAAGEAPSGVRDEIGRQTPRPEPGLLTAADIDDNLNYDFFLKYLGRAREQAPVLPAVDLSNRVTIHVVAEDGSPVSNAAVAVTPEGAASPCAEGYTGTDGVFHFFPGFDGAGGARRFEVSALPQGPSPEGQLNPPPSVGSATVNLDGGAEAREVTLRLPGAAAASPEALDLMFVMDTTGSMSDELEYITTELEGIVARLKERFPDVAMRFGLVVYRDEGDEYVVKTFDFTDSVETMRQQLAAQSANGGGDYPEAVEQALGSAVDRNWTRGSAVKLLLHIAAAPPHDANLGAMLERIKSFRRLGIHTYPIGASGVADTAEYMMRVAAAPTHGRYLWLTDDSGIGLSHAEPKVPGYVVTKLNDLIYRVIASELAGERVEPTPDAIIRTVGQYDRGVCRPDEQQ